MSSSDPTDAPQAQDIEEAVIVPAERKQMSSFNDAGVPRLSVVSRKYDIDGDGVLDEAEQAMRDMDKEGRGHLSNAAVYNMMREQMQMQRDLFKFKKVVAGLVGFVVLLALSNLGTSFAAAFLAKDTTTNDSGQLVNTKTNEAVATQTTADFYAGIERVKDAENARELCANAGGSYECSTSSYLSINSSTAKELIKRCSQGSTVYVKRTWNDDSQTLVQICPPSDGTYGTRYSSMTLKNGVSLRKVGGSYVLDGDAFTQDENEPCDVDADCDNGLNCVSNMCAAPASETGSAAEGETCEADADCAGGLGCNVSYCFNPPCGTCGCNTADNTGCDTGRGETCGIPSCLPDAVASCSTNHDADCP